MHKCRLLILCIDALTAAAVLCIVGINICLRYVSCKYIVLFISETISFNLSFLIFLRENGP